LEELVKLVWLKDEEKIPATFNDPGLRADVQRQRALDDLAFSRIWSASPACLGGVRQKIIQLRWQGAQSDLLELRG
jgi:hypothetical protein